MAKQEVYVEVSTSSDPDHNFAMLKFSDRKEDPTVSVVFDSNTGRSQVNMTPAQIELLEKFDSICKGCDGKRTAPFCSIGYPPYDIDLGSEERNGMQDKTIEIHDFGTICAMGYSEIEYDDGRDAKGNGLGVAVDRQDYTHICIQTPAMVSGDPKGALFLRHGKGLFEVPQNRLVESGKSPRYSEDHDGKLGVENVLTVRFRDISLDPGLKTDEVRFRMEIHDPFSEAFVSIDSRVGIDEKSLNPKQHEILAKFRQTVPRSVTMDVNLLAPECINAMLINVPHEDHTLPNGVDFYEKPRTVKIDGIGSVQLDYCRGNFTKHSEGDDKWVNVRLFAEGNSDPEQCIHFENVAGAGFRSLQAYMSTPARENPRQGSPKVKPAGIGR